MSNDHIKLISQSEKRRFNFNKLAIRNISYRKMLMY